MKEVGVLTAKVKVAEETLGHAYNRGMHDRIRLDSELEGLRHNNNELEAEIRRVR